MERSSTDVPGGEVRDPRRLVRDVLLRDGSTLRLQATQPSDFEELKAFYESLEHDSRYFRFHGLGRVDMVARAEAEASGIDRLALVGRHDGVVVSVASYNGLREPGVAEVASPWRIVFSGGASARGCWSSWRRWGPSARSIASTLR